MSAAQTDLQPAVTHPITRPIAADVEDGEIVDIPRTASQNSPTSETISVDDPKKMTSASVASPRSPQVSEMTAEDLERAKDLVLDLLGWGVEPEYLVDCGVSAAGIHRIFADLKLRLPRNMA